MSVRPATPADLRLSAWRVLRHSGASVEAVAKALDILMIVDAAEAGDELMAIHLAEYLARTRVVEQRGRMYFVRSDPAQETAR
jgi:hypothetical protein